MTAPRSFASVPDGPMDEGLVLSVERRTVANSTDSPKVQTGRTGWRTWAAVATFWVAASLLAGTATFLARRGATAPPGWSDEVWGPLVAGVLWIPITIAIIEASARFPPLELGNRMRVRPWPASGHALASVAVTFGLNGAFIAVTQPELLLSPGDLGNRTLRVGLSFLHLNMGVYWTIVAGAIAAPILRARVRRADNDLPADQTLTVRSGASRIRVRVSEIRWIEGAGDYVRLHLPDSEHLLSERLKRLERRLDPSLFVRVHRSAIVNVTAVERLRHVGHGDYEARLEGGAKVRVSRTRRPRLAEVLEAREVPEDGY